MDINIFAIFQSLFSGFAHSSFFAFIKILAGFIIAILLIADILLISKRIRGDWKIAFHGAKVPNLKKTKYMERWEGIKNNAESGDMAKAKIAMIEADQMFGETLEKIGYKGKDTGERISAVKPGQLIGLEEAKFSRVVFKKIVHSSSHEMNIVDIQAALGGYEKVFRGLELLD
ncbi:MAG TPA: hypothetical protein VMQ48_03335 [Candidatus Saccharimonadales bacterium]|jgi:hypothetical protein|nr:hypothetical protein [Candidatus Saccharimonadales bacterium]